MRDCPETGRPCFDIDCADECQGQYEMRVEAVTVVHTTITRRRAGDERRSAAASLVYGGDRGGGKTEEMRRKAGTGYQPRAKRDDEGEPLPPPKAP